jgi:hypothetical protein
MFELRRIVNERMPDVPNFLPIHCIYFGPVFSEIFESEEEAEQRRRLRQSVGDGFHYCIHPL